VPGVKQRDHLAGPDSKLVLFGCVKVEERPSLAESLATSAPHRCQHHDLPTIESRKNKRERQWMTSWYPGRGRLALGELERLCQRAPKVGVLDSQHRRPSERQCGQGITRPGFAHFVVCSALSWCCWPGRQTVVKGDA
jgi:hypothetical protein